MATQQTIKQTAVSVEDIQRLKIFALQHNQHLKDLYAEAILQLIQHRQAMQQRGQRMMYLASPSDGKELNIKMPIQLAQRINRIATADHTSARRFLYTALVLFTSRRGLSAFEFPDINPKL